MLPRTVNSVHPSTPGSASLHLGLSYLPPLRGWILSILAWWSKNIGVQLSQSPGPTRPLFFVSASSSHFRHSVLKSSQSFPSSLAQSPPSTLRQAQGCPRSRSYFGELRSPPRPLSHSPPLFRRIRLPLRQTQGPPRLVAPSFVSIRFRQKSHNQRSQQR